MSAAAAQIAPGLVAAALIALGSWEAASQQQGRGASAVLPLPALHHIHINSVDPDASLAWHAEYWPSGRRTTWAGSPAFFDDIYVLYTKVPKLAPGAFDRGAPRPRQRPAWTSSTSRIRTACSWRWLPAASFWNHTT